MFRALIDDLLQLQDGFVFRGKTYHLVCLGMKGDLPYLAKTGNFTRHWLRAERKARDKKKGKGPGPVGVCWLCHAGTDAGGPWEDFNLNSQWSQVEAPEPWFERPSVLRLFHQPSCPETMFKPDIWHNYHGGCGKLFIASCLAEVLALVDGSSKNEKIQIVDQHLRAWAKKSKSNKMPHSGGFCSERIGLTSYQVQPDASWSKHDDTRVYHSFLEDWLTSMEDVIASDAYFCRILWAVRSINRMCSILYHAGLWLTREEALEAGRLGRQWLRLYVELADMSFKASKLRFPLVVKHHMMDHHVRSILKGAQFEWSWNCLIDSVQLDEDFIGHAARIARRVSPVSQAERVLQRYLARAFREWGRPRGLL